MLLSKFYSFALFVCQFLLSLYIIVTNAIYFIVPELSYLKLRQYLQATSLKSFIKRKKQPTSKSSSSSNSNSNSNSNGSNSSSSSSSSSSSPSKLLSYISSFQLVSFHYWVLRLIYILRFSTCQLTALVTAHLLQRKPLLNSLFYIPYEMYESLLELQRQGLVSNTEIQSTFQSLAADGKLPKHLSIVVQQEQLVASHSSNSTTSLESTRPGSLPSSSSSSSSSSRSETHSDLSNGTTSNSVNGHQTNGHQTNGHQTNGHQTNGHQTNGHINGYTNGHVPRALWLNDHNSSSSQQQQQLDPSDNKNISSALFILARASCWALSSGIKLVTLYDDGGIISERHAEFSARVKDILTNELFVNSEKPTFKVNVYTTESSFESKISKDLNEDNNNNNNNNNTKVILLLNHFDGRARIVRTAASLASKTRKRETEVDNITVSEFSNHMKEQLPIPDPDILIQFGDTHSIAGFLPWHIRVTEIFHIPSLALFDYVIYASLIDRYSTCEQRYGK